MHIMPIMIIQPHTISVGGTDVTPDALDWDDIAVTNTAVGRETNQASEQTLAGIDAPITLKAAWTSTSSHPAKGQWIKNGVAVQSISPTPVSVNAVVGDKLYFALAANYTFPSGNYDTGTVTVTNTTDSDASIDSFDFVVQYVYSASGGGGGAGGGSGGSDDPTDNNPPGGGQDAV